MRHRLPLLPRRTLTAMQWMAVFSLALLGVTCRDNPVAPRGGGRAAFAVRPYIAQHIDLSGFGLTIDSLRLVVVHAPADTLRDTTAYFNPDSTQLHLNISLILSQPSESLKVSLILSAGGVPLFSGTQTAIVSVGSSSSATPISIPMFFTGPGAGVTALHLSPVDSVLHFSDSLRFRVTADSAGIPVTNFYTAWRTSDTLAARVNAFGILHAPAARKAVYVVVRTYSGATDSTPVTFIPTPTLLAVQGGNGQAGTVGGLLPGALQVKVTAADGLGVKGIPVQFSILTGGGSLSAPQAITDTLGLASVTATLGTVAGPVSYQAATAGLTAVTFAETVKPGLPTQLLANTGAGQSATAGALLPIAPSVVAKDTFNNLVPGVVVTFTVGAGAGHITGATDTTNASGVATVGSWTLDTLAHVDSLTATLGALTRVFTASGLAGAISTAKSLVTLVADSVLSGTAGTITLRARDQYGNALTAGGSVVSFTVSGGTSTGSLSAVTDHADGTYTATFTGTLVGTADTVHATIGGVAVSSPLPLLRVVPGAVSLAQSVLVAAGAIDSSGLQDSVILTAKDQNGNVITSPQTVVFSKAGGTSTGNLSGTVNLGSGKYATVFTGMLAGTATTISATIGGQNVTSTLPTIQVVPGLASVATSVVSVTQGSVAVGAHSIVTLLAKDAAGNALTSGGLAVVFSLAGGTSSLSLGTPGAHDNGNGSYTDTLTALVPGTATAVHASIGGTSVTSAAPSITVVLGGLITSQSVVTVDSATLASGDSSVVHLQAKDSAGINLTVGGLTVVFFDSGGTSTGTVGPTTDHANGTYTAVFHGLLAGTATTMHATINGVTVSSTLPTVTVTPGLASPATSVVTAPVDSIASGASVLFTIQLKDAAGNALTTPGGPVVFSTIAGTSTGTFVPTPAAYAGAGTDTARFTGVLAGTVDSVKATVNGNPVTTAKPTLFVFPGPASPVTSTVSVSDSVVAAGGIDTLRLTTRDAAGNLLGKGGQTVAFTISGGTSTGNITATTDLGNGTYQAIFTGLNAGSAVSVGATIGGTPVTSALPTLRVNTTVHVSNILADSTWTAVASPHIVHGYLKVANGATLTIQAGAVVKFDTASGLQVGDTAAGQAGGLSLAGTAAQPISLTVDSTAIRPGFWKGIEVQRLLAPASWTHVLLEGAGGTRIVAGFQSCLLSVNGTGAALTVDSLQVRACLNDGIVLAGGVLTVRRSTVDSASSTGIQGLGGGTLTLDTTVIRGNGNLGVGMSPGTILAQAVGNKFLGNGHAPGQPAAAIEAFHLPHFGVQDSIAGNAVDAVVINGGAPDPSVAAFTLHRLQPAGQYQVFGSLVVGSPTGQTMTLDSGIIMTFSPQSALIIGDSAGGKPGLLRTLSTGPANGVLLTSNQPGPTPGAWTGLEFGNLSGPDTVVGLHVQFAGDSIPGYTTRRAGILVRNPSANELVILGADLANNGSALSPNNAAGVFVSGSGGGVHVYGSNVLNTVGFGFAYTVPGVRLVGDTVLGSAVTGLGIFVPASVILPAADSVANSRFSASGLYPAIMGIGATPAIYPAPNAWTGNARDTILLSGGAVLGQTVTVPRVPGVTWRTLTPVSVSAGGTLAFARGDTVAFDTLAAIIVGDTLNGPGALTAIAPDTAPILFTATPGSNGHWRGITYLATAGDTSLRNVTVDAAGYFQPCLIIDCNGQPIGAIHIIGTPTANLVFDSITVRNSLYYAIQTNAPGSPGGVVVSHSQFYENRYFNIFFASHGPALTIDSSDIYAYHSPSGASAIFNSNGTFDSVVAVNNWWGDVAGPGRIAFGSPDSLGRTLIDTAQSGIAYAPFATAPYFPVGLPGGLMPVADSQVFCCSIQAGLQPLPDSIRVRAVDAHLRGVAGQVVTWNAASSASGNVVGSSPTDIGGRVGAVWSPGVLAKFDTAQASLGGGITTDIFVNVFPALLSSVHWQYIPGRTEGKVSATLDTALFTASGHVGAIVTHAVDAFNNPVFANNLYFDTLPGTGVPRNYGALTRVGGDTIFFVDTADVGAPFQLHGIYQTGTGQLEDSVVIETGWVPFGVRAFPDTVVFNSICPVGPGNVFCSHAVTAQLLDSLGAVLPPNGQVTFIWTGVGPISVDSTGGPSFMTAFVTARDTGTGTLMATHTGPLFQDTVFAQVVVRQVPGQVAATPDTISTGIGDTVTFHAIVADSGGTPLATPPPVQWQITSQFPGLVKLDSAADSLRVRFDSGVYSFGQFEWVGVVNPFFQHVAGDTVFGQGVLFNPIVYNVVGSGTSSGAQSRAAVDTATNQTFYTSSVNGVVYVNDNTTNGIVGGITTGGASPIWLTVSHAGGADKVYVSNNGSGTVTVIDPTTRGVSNTITLPQTTTPYGITAADPLGRVYVAARYCPGFPGLCTTEVAVMPIDVAGDSVVTADIVVLNADSLRTPQGLAYNPNDQRLYVAMDSGYVKVVNPATNAEVGTILVQGGMTLTDVAVNPVTDTVYVSNWTGGGIAVIDPTTGTVVNSLPANTPQGISVDPLHNRIYYASSSNNTVNEIDGNTENFHTVIVGGSGDFPQAAAADPRTGTVYAPHFSALTVLQFYGKPVGQALGAPPFRGAAPVAMQAPKRLLPMKQAPAPVRAKPAAQPGTRTLPALPRRTPAGTATASPATKRRPTP